MDSQKNMTHAAKTICISSSQVILTTPQGTPEIAPAFVEISGNVISQITRVPALSYSSELAKLKLQTTGPKNFELHDFGSFVVAPAWVNAHTHLAMNFFRGLAVESQVAGNLVHDLFFGLESHLKPDDVRAFSRVAAYECLLSGTGLVWDHYYHAEAAAQGIADTGLCAVVAPTLQDLSGPGCQLWQQHLDQTLSIQANSALRSAGIYAALGPHATDTVSAPFWKKIIDTAKAHTLPVHVHLAQSPEEFQHSMDRNQQSPAAFLHSTGLLSESIKCTLVHNIYCSQSDFALFEPEFHTLVFCPSSQLVFHFPANVMVWEKNRATWCVATDCAASNDTMNVQRELAQVGGTVRSPLPHRQTTKIFFNPELKKTQQKQTPQELHHRACKLNFRVQHFYCKKCGKLRVKCTLNFRQAPYRLVHWQTLRFGIQITPTCGPRTRHCAVLRCQTARPHFIISCVRANGLELRARFKTAY